jgi:hypothetical protein
MSAPDTDRLRRTIEKLMSDLGGSFDIDVRGNQIYLRPLREYLRALWLPEGFDMRFKASIKEPQGSLEVSGLVMWKGEALFEVKDEFPVDETFWYLTDMIKGTYRMIKKYDLVNLRNMLMNSELSVRFEWCKRADAWELCVVAEDLTGNLTLYVHPMRGYVSGLITIAPSFVDYILEADDGKFVREVWHHRSYTILEVYAKMRRLKKLLSFLNRIREVLEL